ncbi:MAG: hypothetical protein Q7J73_06305 [Dehalococcoidales bacterium]|nr:hypothetical protein [Dehalococcoidales bacterium]
MFGRELVQNFGVVQMAPQDLNGNATGSAWIGLTHYGHATFFFLTGESANDAAVTFKQATSATGTGSKTLAYTKYWSNGQKLMIGTVSGTFVAAETITGGTSNLTAYVHTVSSGHMLVIPLTGGTTWTDGETITGGTSGATAVMSGTGQDEDIMLDRTCSSTFTYPSVTFKTYAIEIDGEDMDVENGYDFVQANIADPGGASISAGMWFLSFPDRRGIPMTSAIGTQKIVADFA